VPTGKLLVQVLLWVADNIFDNLMFETQENLSVSKEWTIWH